MVTTLTHSAKMPMAITVFHIIIRHDDGHHRVRTFQESPRMRPVLQPRMPGVMLNRHCR